MERKDKVVRTIRVQCKIFNREDKAKTRKEQEAKEKETNQAKEQEVEGRAKGRALWNNNFAPGFPGQ